MTTIAYKDGILASDRRLTYEGKIMSDSTQKIFKLNDGSIAALAGDAAAAFEYIKWLQSDRTSSSPVDEMHEVDFSIMIIAKDGTVSFIENGKMEPPHKPEKYYALGSGRAAALGAMAFGATAAQAVKFAMRVDSSTGGGVDTLTIITEKKAKRNDGKKKDVQGGKPEEGDSPPQDQE